MADVYVAAGSNVEPEKYLCRALQALEESFSALTVSPAYRNPAVGFAGSDFINLVVGFRTQLPVADVRKRLQEIEAQCDRPRTAPKWAPRTMDLDILIYDELVSSEPGLVLPRPDLVRRPYMLRPMTDIAPDLRHPVLGKTMKELWRELDAGDHEMTQVFLSDPVTSQHSGRRPPPGSGQ